MKYKIKHLSDTFSHPDFRWDGEYFCFEPYKNRKLKYIPINDILSHSQYGISISMNEEKVGTKIYRMNEINNMLCSHNISKYATIDSDTIQVYKLKDKDILFNRTNSFKFVGRTGIFRKFSNDEIVFASYLVRIRPKSEIITPEYLTAFLNTKYGITDIKRRARSSINQSNVNPEELKKVEIPLLSRKLQEKVIFLFDEAFNLLQKSELKYNKAQSLLLSELGLIGWKPKHQLSFVKQYSDVEKSERIDAEYFQPKYEEIIKKIKDYKGGCDELENLTEYINSGNQPPYTEGGEIKFFSQKWIKDKGIDYSFLEENDEPMVLKSFFKEDKNKSSLVTKGDILYYSVGANLGFCHNYLADEPIAVGSFINIIRADKTKINEVFLGFILNSIIGRAQGDKEKSGLAQPYIYAKNLKKIKIPLVHSKIQDEIQGIVFESLNLHKQSRQLLEYSKYAIEKAIEKDEKTAIHWLKDKLSR